MIPTRKWWYTTAANGRLPSPYPPKASNKGHGRIVSIVPIVIVFIGPILAFWTKTTPQGMVLEGRQVAGSYNGVQLGQFWLWPCRCACV